MLIYEFYFYRVENKKREFGKERKFLLNLPFKDSLPLSQWILIQCLLISGISAGGIAFNWGHNNPIMHTRVGKHSSRPILMTSKCKYTANKKDYLCSCHNQMTFLRAVSTSYCVFNRRRIESNWKIHRERGKWETRLLSQCYPNSIEVYGSSVWENARTLWLAGVKS
jgi:hypothetical protein